MTDPARPRSRRPTRGRSSATHDIIEAAGRLYAERGPTSVSLRDVADAADVNIGLIHHYIGNKQDLITAVFGRPPLRDLAPVPHEQLIDGIARLLVANDPDNPDAMRFIAEIRAALDGIDLAGMSRFPLTKTLYERAAEHTTPDDAQVRAVFILSAVAGWLVFGRPALTAISAPTPTDEVMRRSLIALLTQALLDDPTSP